MQKENSPFTPGSPVPVELFVGRSAEIEQVLQLVSQSASGRQENVFLIGDRGIGKSSLGSFILHLAKKRHNMIGVHTFLGGVNTLEEMVRCVFEDLLKATANEPWYQKIGRLFGNHVRDVGLFGISLSFNPPKADLTELVRQYPDAVTNILRQMPEEKKGLCMILDDINGLADTAEFANWYKSFVDKVATSFPQFPVLMMLVGTHEKRDRLVHWQESLTRVFRIVEIERLGDEDVKNFFEKTFTRANHRLSDDETTNTLVRYSSGLPVLMHEIGDATFWMDNDQVIDRDDAWSGVFAAAETIGKKYLTPKVYRAIRSERYRSILRKFADLPIETCFQKRDMESLLSAAEKKVFNNFLTKLRKLGVIELDSERERGSYKFVNSIYPVYILLEAQLYKKKHS